ncbi:hypothetical protein PQU92_03540 [Asticcacaulis sp. BYS171W]|uniref:Transglutaminase-like domain-containing protein n=1 Tax=Asticcacaulis aquaticus TaxID=2984212 RepID=A0ABT5HQI5_9CAUL|nr:hypothetical protein [Asticcacaulis aquaticus]MDC7682332.1 hypothetical protein [Asticcacaulis aquaticus]
MNTDLERQKIEVVLRAEGIDPGQPGFYAHPAFVARCATDPAFIELYARWVDLRPVEAGYEARVRDVVPRLCDIILSTLKADGWEGACVEAASMMIRMLERLGIWSYGILGSTTFIVEPEGIWCGFYRHDFQDFPMAVLGHAWLVVPPLRLIDPTVSQQCWGDDPIRNYLPKFIATDGVTDVTPDVSDVISRRMRDYFASMDDYWDDNLHLRLQPNLPVFAEHFPAVQYQREHLITRYVPINIHLPDAPLEALNSDGHMGRPAIDIWRDLVAPAFGVEP